MTIDDLAVLTFSKEPAFEFYHRGQTFAIYANGYVNITGSVRESVLPVEATVIINRIPQLLSRAAGEAA